jgi:hypothetical protein
MFGVDPAAALPFSVGKAALPFSIFLASSEPEDRLWVVAIPVNERRNHSYYRTGAAKMRCDELARRIATN